MSNQILSDSIIWLCARTKLSVEVLVLSVNRSQPSCPLSILEITRPSSQGESITVGHARKIKAIFIEHGLSALTLDDLFLTTAQLEKKFGSIE